MGLEVFSIPPFEHGLESVRQSNFDVAVFHPDVPQVERNQFASRLKQIFPQLCLIFLYEQQIHATEMADAVLNAGVTPHDLNMSIRYLMGKRNTASA